MSGWMFGTSSGSPSWFRSVSQLLRVMICVLCCFALTRAEAQLRFRIESPHAGLWRRVYSQLPSAWKARRVVYVREVTDREMDRFVEQFEGPNDRTDSII